VGDGVGGWGAKRTGLRISARWDKVVASAQLHDSGAAAALNLALEIHPWLYIVRH